MNKELEEHSIDQISSKLSHLLADTFVLYVKTLNYHWNMVGEEFFMYHKLLEEQYKKLAELCDESAERIRMLKREAPATMQTFLQLTGLKEGSSKKEQKQMVDELASDHAHLVRHCRQIIEYSDSISDPATSDLVVDQMRFHDKASWLLRSHL